MFDCSASLAFASLAITLSVIAPTTHAQESPESFQSEWVHYTMDDLEVEAAWFREPVRGRYLQVMLDLNGNESVQSQGIVHLELDHAVHSGPWDGQFPAIVEPWREHGLLIEWRVQNGLYNGFDRVMTDSRMSTIQRAMPAGAYGLLMGATFGKEHARIRVPLDQPDSSFVVTRRHLPHGALNVLTVPYVLSAMDLQPGDRFTLPGFALIGGPEGVGRRWRGAFKVMSVMQRMVGEEIHTITEVLQWGVDPSQIDSLSGDVLPPQPGQRFTRQLVSERAPYFIGRGNYLAREGEPAVRIREQLDLVAWAPLPLSDAELIREDVWDVDSTANMFMLKPQQMPDLLLPRDE